MRKPQYFSPLVPISILTTDKRIFNPSRLDLDPWDFEELKEAEYLVSDESETDGGVGLDGLEYKAIGQKKGKNYDE